jgi:hypothetical protein
MASIGRGNLRCKVQGCNRVRPYWADECKGHRKAKPKVDTNKPTFCGNRESGCGAELTEADFENGACTQCSYPLGVSGLPLEHQLLLSLREIQSQRDEEVA